MYGLGAKEGNLLSHAIPDVEGVRDACVYFTTGTSDQRRPILFSQKNLLTYVDQLNATFSPLLHSRKKTMACLPVFHSVARMINVLHLMHGFPLIFVEEAKNLFYALRTAGPQVIFTTGADLEKLCVEIENEMATWPGFQKILFEKTKIKALLGGELETIISCASPLPNKSKLFLQHLGVQVVNLYGLTETLGG